MYSQILMFAFLQNVDFFEGKETLLILSPSAILTSSEPAVQNRLLVGELMCFASRSSCPDFLVLRLEDKTSGCSLICVLIELLEIGPEKKKGIKGGGGLRGWRQRSPPS